MRHLLKLIFWQNRYKTLWHKTSTHLQNVLRVFPVARHKCWKSWGFLSSGHHHRRFETFQKTLKRTLLPPSSKLRRGVSEWFSALRRDVILLTFNQVVRSAVLTTGWGIITRKITSTPHRWAMRPNKWYTYCFLLSVIRRDSRQMIHCFVYGHISFQRCY